MATLPLLCCRTTAERGKFLLCLPQEDLYSLDYSVQPFSILDIVVPEIDGGL